MISITFLTPTLSDSQVCWLALLDTLVVFFNYLCLLIIYHDLQVCQLALPTGNIPQCRQPLTQHIPEIDTFICLMHDYFDHSHCLTPARLTGLLTTLPNTLVGDFVHLSLSDYSLQFAGSLTRFPECSSNILLQHQWQPLIHPVEPVPKIICFCPLIIHHDSKVHWLLSQTPQ